MRIVSEIAVLQGDEPVFSLTGSMSLSQDPVVEFDYRSNGADAMHVRVTDSDGATWRQSFPIGHGS